ncbi:MAG: hypothetical protein QOI41_693, partial [Myxococcales bacterium]|nr:hypothetical protein [Myxococcales bacterium]
MNHATSHRRAALPATIVAVLRNVLFLLVLAALSVAQGCGAPESEQESEQSHEGVARAALTGTITVNAATRYQTMQGWGVDGQPRSWGNTGTNFKSQVLDRLIDDMGSNLFRVEIYKGASDWESTNDDSNPNNYNWTYYDNLYSTNKDFQDFVAYIRYLNSKGITNNIEVAAHGLAPTWMAGSHNGLGGACVTQESGCTGVPANAADEWAEEIVSFIEWSHNRLSPPLQFGYIAPFNETDLCTTEGICLGGDSAAVVSLLSKIVTRMNAFPDLASVKLIAPEAANVGSDSRSQILANPTVAPRIGALAYHIYSPGSAPAENTYNTANPPEWNTEFNGFSAICANSIGWGEAKTHADLLTADLQAGNTVELVWADVDAWHIHQDNFQTFGLFFTSFTSASPPVANNSRCGMGSPPTATQLDGAVYSPNVTYYVTKQFSKFVKPGAQRIDVSSSDSGNGSAVGFLNTDGSVIVAGRNKSTTANQSVTVSIAGLSNAPTSLTQYYTTSSASFVQDPASYALTNNAGTLTSGPIVIPPDSVFTLVTSSVNPTVTLQTPTAGQVFANGPSSVSFTSSATASSGRTITQVGYYEGSTLLCTGTSASSYGCTSTMARGTHSTVTAKATDNTTATGTSAPITFYVQSTPPTVGITGPVASGTYTASGGSALTFSATATAASGLSIARVDFVEGGTVLCTATVAPSYSCTWTVPASGGNHVVVARATDTSNNQASSSSITVAVTGPSVLLGDTTVESADDTTSAGFVDSYQYTATSSGAVTSLNAYLPTTNASTSLQLGLYTEGANKPGTLLGSCSVGTVTNGAWNACTLASGVSVMAGTSYWIAAMTTAGSETLRATTATGT